MEYAINRVAVIGAGTMGAAIAAHLANAGIPAYLLDIVPRELTAKEEKARDSPSTTRRCATASSRRAGSGASRPVRPTSLPRTWRSGSRWAIWRTTLTGWARWTGSLR